MFKKIFVLLFALSLFAVQCNKSNKNDSSVETTATTDSAVDEVTAGSDGAAIADEATTATEEGGSVKDVDQSTADESAE